MFSSLKGLIRIGNSILLLAALSLSLYMSDSTYILIVLLPIVILDRAFLIPLLFTIPVVEGVYSTDSTASNSETIAIAMLVPILAYDLLKANKKMIPFKVVALYLIFIIMAFVGLIVYKRHHYISSAIAIPAHMPYVPALGKVAAKILKITFFLVYVKLLINYGKEYIYQALNLFRALSPYIIIVISGYTLLFGHVSTQFGGVIHFGQASHGDFTASLDALCVFLYLALFERSNRYFEKFMALVAIGFLLYLIMQMGSRNGLLSFGFVSVLGVFLVMRNRSWTFQFLIVGGAFIAGVTALYFFQDSPTIQRAIYEMTDQGGGERLDYWYAGGQAIKDAPILGLGGDESASLYAVGKWSPSVTDHVMHNTFLEIAVEYGLLGLTFYLIFVYTILRWGYKQVLYAIDTNDLILGTPAIAYTVSIMAGMFISRVWDTTLWYYLGIVFAIGILWIEPLKAKARYFVRSKKPKLSSQLVTA